ncbi:molybdopterin-guanine dinucleotide biosynthesis protein A [Sphingobium faniae]|nr:molybdopterin-guanine dinucleotide biosynthesis protein A [Sphingobium faniae]
MTGGILGVVLAGGSSSRFGTDKAKALYRGRTLLDWSVGSLEGLVDNIVISGRPHPVHRSVEDRPHDGLGPLGGIAGAMATAAERGFAHVLSLPCDTPEVPRALLVELCTQTRAAYAATCPVIGLWPSALAGELDEHLRRTDDRSIQGWSRRIGAQPIGIGLDIPNINDVGDLERLTQPPKERS